MHFGAFIDILIFANMCNVFFFAASGILRPRGTNNNSIRKPKKVLKMYHAIEIILYAHLISLIGWKTMRKRENRRKIICFTRPK